MASFFFSTASMPARKTETYRRWEIGKVEGCFLAYNVI
jgi:hypothetical protein